MAVKKETEQKEMDCHSSALLDRSHILSFSYGGEASPAVVQPASLKSPVLPVISTGFRLALNEQNQLQQELTALLSQQKDEIEQFLLAQREQLRLALAERWQQHSLTFVTSVKELVGKKLVEKEAEVEQHARLNAELEERLRRLRAECRSWRAKSMADQAIAASLRAQIQQMVAAKAAAAAHAGEDCFSETSAEDARSVNVDPQRHKAPQLLCRACHWRSAAVVLIPCRHLCLCPACDSAGEGKNCPACGCVRSGSVHIFL